MKVQIESTPKYLENMLENTDTDGYIYGFGSSHCWIKQESNNGRILFITENK